MTIEHEESEVPQINWPSVITDENRASISNHLEENRSLAVAVALAIIDEVKDLAQQEFKIWVSLSPEVGSRPEIMFGGHFRDWSSYQRAAHAILNATSIIETGKPYQEPGTDYEAIEREGKMSFKDFLLDKDELEELQKQRKAAGEIVWFNRELTFADLYKVTESPLDFVDAVIQQEIDRMRQEDRKEIETVRDLTETVQQLERERDEIDIESQDTSKDGEVVEFIEGVGSMETERKVDAMERGGQRFCQLYQEFNH